MTVLLILAGLVAALMLLPAAFVVWLAYGVLRDTWRETHR